MKEVTMIRENIKNHAHYLANCFGFRNGYQSVEDILIEMAEWARVEDVELVDHENVYPLTVIQDRYNGVYSGAKYTAWNKEHWLIPEEVDGGDGECDGFWSEYEREEYLRLKYPVGKGDTPNKAIMDLITKLRRKTL